MSLSLYIYIYIYICTHAYICANILHCIIYCNRGVLSFFLPPNPGCCPVASAPNKPAYYTMLYYSIVYSVL